MLLRLWSVRAAGRLGIGGSSKVGGCGLHEGAQTRDRCGDNAIIQLDLGEKGGGGEVERWIGEPDYRIDVVKTEGDRDYEANSRDVNEWSRRRLKRRRMRPGEELTGGERRMRGPL